MQCTSLKDGIRRTLALKLTALIMAGLALQITRAQDPAAGTNQVTQLPPIVVQGEAEYEERIQPMFPPPVQGTEIYAGKKASIIDLDAFPKVQANNYRQALAKTPGLLYSEETSPLVSIGYRGIGEPHRMQFFQVLKDGIPIHADMFGYPEAYYTPPLDVVDRIEFVRGGASLMYGPQPAGALNYVTYQPRRDRPISARSQHVFGSDSLYSTYNSVDGTVGRLGYLAYYNHRESDGFRSDNSDYVLDGGHFKVVLDADRDSRWMLAFDAYEEEHGEPGGLNFGTGPLDNNYEEDRERATRLHDRFRLRRYVPSLSYEHDFSEDTLLTVKSWGGYYDRWSKRQLGGGFGTFPTNSAVDIERQEFYTFGIESRVRHDYTALNNDHTFTGGLLFYHADSPRTDRRGATPDAEDGIVFRESDRQVLYGSVFFENRFRFDRLSVVPGFRLENINQDLSTENFNSGTGEFLSAGEKDKLDVQPLVALGLAYQTTEKSEIYANVSQSYRTTIFTESLVVPTAGTFVEGDIDPVTGWSYELGYRGGVGQWLTWDTSLFLIDLDNKFGGTATTSNITILRNVGRSINYGWDAMLELDIIGALDAAQGTDYVHQWGSLSAYGNVSLLEAEIHGGVSDGFSPQYAPDYIIRTGAIYRWRDKVKVAMLGTVVDDHFATDDESLDRAIPSYMTWDLTAEAKLYKDNFSLIAGVNNLFDEDYYARVRGDGIDPAYGRNYYAGFSVAF